MSTIWNAIEYKENIQYILIDEMYSFYSIDKKDGVYSIKFCILVILKYMLIGKVIFFNYSIIFW